MLYAFGIGVLWYNNYGNFVDRDIIQERREAGTFVFEAVSNLGTSIKNIFADIKTGYGNWINDTFNYDYYSGDQEKVEIPQGVYLKELERGDLIYRPGSPIYVWARLEAKTLDEKITADISCKTEDENEVEIFGQIDEPTVTILTGVERSIPCEFANLDEGDYEIKFTADFNFGADARKKVYLMDRERMINDFEVLIDRGLKPSKEDVLRELYDIQDTEPESIVTSGPISVAIATDSVPWDIGESYNFKPLFGVTIENIWQDGGTVKKITKIEFMVPEDMEIEDCDQEVDTNNFDTESEFKIYKVDPDSELIQDIEDYVTINCRMNVDHDNLDNTPVTTRFLKVHVDYEYVLEEEIDIEVEGYGLEGDVAGVVGRNQVCCEIIVDSGMGVSVDYVINSPEKCTEINEESHKEAKPVISNYCEKKCCRISKGTEFEYYWVADDKECINLRRPGGTAELLPQEKYNLCDSAS